MPASDQQRVLAVEKTSKNALQAAWFHGCKNTLSSDELRAIKGRICNWRQTVLFALLVFTGMRKDEIRRLTWENINWAEATATFAGKGGKVRTVPLRDEVLDALVDAWDASGTVRAPEDHLGPVLWTQGTGGGVRGRHYAERGDSFAKLLRTLTTDHSFHIFRKTVATSLGRNGVQQAMIETILGWASESMYGSTYFAPNTEDLHRAILKLYKDAPIKDN